MLILINPNEGVIHILFMPAIPKLFDFLFKRGNKAGVFRLETNEYMKIYSPRSKVIYTQMLRVWKSEVCLLTGFSRMLIKIYKISATALGIEKIYSNSLIRILYIGVIIIILAN